MRIFPAFAAAAFLAASPCVAQVVIRDGADNSARHETRADQQDHAAQHDEHEARRDAAAGDYRAAQHEQADAQHHEAVAQHQERRADQDNRGGVKVEIGR
jgi:hypothetical protein